MNKCPNCGAFYTNGRCDYCGTIFSRPLRVDINETIGTFTFKGRTVPVRLVEIREECESMWADDKVVCSVPQRPRIILEVMAE